MGPPARRRDRHVRRSRDRTIGDERTDYDEEPPVMTATEVTTIPPVSRAEAERLAADEYVRLTAQLRALTDDDWAKPTDCPLWDVRAIAGHSVAMMGDFT